VRSSPLVPHLLRIPSRIAVLVAFLMFFTSPAAALEGPLVQFLSRANRAAAIRRCIRCLRCIWTRC
jgi:hypothetical protein